MQHIATVFRILLSAILLLLCCTPTYAQRTADTLKEVNIRSAKQVSQDTRLNDFAPGQKVIAIDTTALQQYRLQNAATLLAQQVPVFVRSYGFNALSTLSFRGSSAAQSAVLWNGVPIRNTALGIADVSTIPVSFISKMNIVYGGSSSLWGSGNVGGALLLENEAPVFDSGRHTLSVSGGAGSFSQYMAGINGIISSRHWYFSAALFAQQAANDFPYTDRNGKLATMPNDKLQSKAALLRIARRLNATQTISLSAWLQQYDRQIPPALFETYSGKQQNDGSLRLLAEWSRHKTTSDWYARTSLIRDDLHYTDDTVLIHSQSTSYQYFQEVGWKKQLGNAGRLLLFSPVRLSWMQVQNETKQQNSIALAAAYDIKLLSNKLNLSASARGEAVNGKSFLLPGTNASYMLTSWLSLRANVQRTYRVPSLNELYYFPGGNPDLKPEQGWNKDAGYTLKLRTGHFTFLHDLSVYDRNIHDWIIWLGGAVWTPHNIAEVHSRGVETENRIVCTAGHWQFHIGINTAYSLSTTVASYIPGDGSHGKQIPYAPRYNGQANIGCSYKKLSLNYNHTYTGYRFITSDESEYTLPYQTGNVQLLFNTSVQSHSLQLSAQCNNIWNTQYEVVSGRPMPGTNFLAGFRLGIL